MLLVHLFYDNQNLLLLDLVRFYHHQLQYQQVLLLGMVNLWFYRTPFHALFHLKIWFIKIYFYKQFFFIPNWSPGTSLNTMSCIVRSKLMYCNGCDWWITIWQVGQLLFSSKCLTRQLLQTIVNKNTIVNEVKNIYLKMFYLHVCKHSVTVVASTKYPLHILHVIWQLRVFNLINFSIIYHKI